MVKLLYSVIFTCLITSLSSQVDTVAIKKEIDELSSIDKKKEYLNKIYVSDQKYRGSDTRKELDKLNLVKSLFYFNRYGFPERKIYGKVSGAITLPYVHNSCPRAGLLCFPIIMEGFRTGEISELTFRESYLRNLYKKIYGNKFYGKDDPKNEIRNGSLDMLLKKIQPLIIKPINVGEVIKTIKEEELFMEQDFDVVGVWYDKDWTSNVRIIKADDGQYYYHKLYNDFSHYPQKLKALGNGKFELFHLTFELTDSGEYLKVFVDKVFDRALKRVKTG